MLNDNYEFLINEVLELKRRLATASDGDKQYLMGMIKYYQSLMEQCTHK